MSTSLLRPAGALRAQLVNTCHQIAQRDMQAIGELDQVEVGGVGLAARDRVDLIETQTSAVIGDRGLGHVLVFGDQDLHGLSERGLILAPWFGLPLGWHERKPYRSAPRSVSQSISYHRCRQSSTTQFAMTSSARSSQRLSLARAIREIREEQGLDPKHFAEKAKMSDRRLAAIEEGRSSYDYATLLALADALGIGASALVIRAKAIDDEEAEHA